MSLAQERLHRFELFQGVELRDVCHVLPIRPDLEEEPVIDPPRKMDGESKSISHHHHVRKDAIAPEQYISFPRHDLHRSEGLREGLQGLIDVDNVGWPVPQNLGAITCAARMTLVRSREAAFAPRACPTSSHTRLA